ncbi:MAG: flagellar basal body P-ring formation protein FlgA [Proteobacteria bacterium]|nr:flagellar basal body P-ring formation protein FlgA [Pseudomonadota bacterium]
MIKSLTAATLTAALFAAASATAFAQSAEPARPYLKHDVTVTSSVVRIGDLIENAGIVADIPIFRAPDLGTTGTVPVETVIAAVRPHALVGFDTGGISDVVVTRAAREIAVTDIEKTLAKAIADRFNAGPVAEIKVFFDRDPQTIQVDPTAHGDVQVGRLTYDSRSGRFDTVLEIPTGANGKRGLLRLTGRAYPTVEIVMVSHTVERGAVLRASDLIVERRPRAEIGRDAIAGLDQAIGQAARNTLRPGQALRSADLTKPQIVLRNEMVMLVFEAPGLTLTMRGKALDAGAEGDTVSVLNEQSKRTVQGVVAGPGHVVVRSGTPRLAANIPASTDSTR